jgi:hypothetical protein
MEKRLWPLAIVPLLLFAGASAAQFPVMDTVAGKVVQKYQTATCQELWQNRGKKPSEEQKRAIALLRDDPQMRQAFFDKISGPVMNKMFECGMIP